MASRIRLQALAGLFDAVFTDQYGVLHDGHRPYPGALEGLAALRAQGVPVLILSNSGRSGETNAGRLERLGFSRSLYDRIVTSGDVARRMLTDGEVPLGPGGKPRCLSISTGSDAELADSLGFPRAADGTDAELVIIGGSRGEQVGLDAYRTLLAPAASRNVPCLCTNPDRIMLTGSGTTFGAGRIAELYEELGGTVTWIGKPYPAIYRAAAASLGIADPGAVLCIGDSVEHDVAGARGFGARVALVRTGILSGLSDTALAAECARHGAIPDVVLDGLG